MNGSKTINLLYVHSFRTQRASDGVALACSEMWPSAREHALASGSCVEECRRHQSIGTAFGGIVNLTNPEFAIIIPKHKGSLYVRLPVSHQMLLLSHSPRTTISPSCKQVNSSLLSPISYSYHSIYTLAIPLRHKPNTNALTLPITWTMSNACGLMCATLG